MYPKFIKIVDVSPHDGFQNEPELVTTETKVTLIHMLLNCGLKIIESGAFVSPKCVQKMADSAEVFANRKRKSDVAFSALTPNMKGLVSAMIASVKEVAVFAAASEPFSKKIQTLQLLSV
jgi:hydroxymethylglutaryl-CoA lyase